MSPLKYHPCPLFCYKVGTNSEGGSLFRIILNKPPKERSTLRSSTVIKIEPSHLRRDSNSEMKRTCCSSFPHRANNNFGIKWDYLIMLKPGWLGTCEFSCQVNNSKIKTQWKLHKWHEIYLKRLIQRMIVKRSGNNREPQQRCELFRIQTSFFGEANRIAHEQVT